MFTKVLVEIKRWLFDKRGISPDLYKPLVYWFYLLNPLKKTGNVVFPSFEEMHDIVKTIGLDVQDIYLSRSELEDYISTNIHHYFSYFSTGYGNYFISKTAEHYVSIKLSNFRDGVFIDVAASVSPFYKVIQAMYPDSRVYQQDLIFPAGIHGFRIGGTAAQIPLLDNSVDLITLHNSIEHFVGTEDKEFIEECGRIMKKNGEVIILPIFLEHEHTNYINPTANPEDLILDKDAKIVYTFEKSQFMRHYSAETFNKRILQPAKEKFDIEFIRIICTDDFDEDIELVLALKLTAR